MEWFTPDSSEPVRQGDVLISRDPNTGVTGEKCLVITADCDISKGKFGKQLACLRIIDINDYLRDIWPIRKLEKAYADESEKLRAQLSKWHTRILGSDSTLTAEAAVAWVLREEPEAMCKALKVDEHSEKNFVAAIKVARSVFGTYVEKSNDAPISRLIKFRAGCRALDEDKCRDQILQQARGESLPEDVFLLTSLPQFELNAGLVMLREIVGIDHSAVCYRAADATSLNMFLRVGRLQPTYKYAVSQSFGALYSRIGLPSEYEVRHRNVIANINYEI